MCFLPPVGMMGVPPASGPTLLADFDFSAALASWTAGRTGFSSAYATDEFDFQDYAAGSTYSNTSGVGSDTLSASGGKTAALAVGICDGTDMVSRTAWEPTSTSDYLQASSSSAFDSNLEDFAFRFEFRTTVGWSAGDYIFDKRATNGVLLYVQSNSLRLFLSDGSNFVTFSVSLVGATGLAGYDDGAPHYVSGWVDWSAKIAYMKGDLFSEQSLDISALASTLSNSEQALFANSTTGSSNAPVGTQFCGFSWCTGTDAQSHYDEPFWQHGKKPALLDALDRACLVGVPVAAGSVGLFAPDTFPIGYDPAFAAGLGVYCNNARTNLIPYSVISTGAANTNITPTDNAVDSPAGFRDATTLLATGANGNQARTAVTVASTAYTGVAFIEESTAGVTGRVIAYDESNAAELASTAFVGTSTPQAVVVPFSTIAGGVSTSLRVEVDTDTETVIAYAWQIEAGTGTGAIIPTNGAAASLVQSNYRATGDYVQESTGELVSVFVVKKMPASGETHYVFDTVAAADRRALFIDDTGALKFLANDGAGSLVATITLGTVVADTEYTATCQWDEAAGLDGASVRGKVNAVAKVTGGSAFTSGASFTSEICFGASDTTANTALDGYIQSIVSNDGASAMAT